MMINVIVKFCDLNPEMSLAWQVGNCQANQRRGEKWHHFSVFYFFWRKWMTLIRSVSLKHESFTKVHIWRSPCLSQCNFWLVDGAVRPPAPKTRCRVSQHRQSWDPNTSQQDLFRTHISLLTCSIYCKWLGTLECWVLFKRRKERKYNTDWYMRWLCRFSGNLFWAVVTQR